MSLKENWLSSFEKFENKEDTLKNIRQKAIEVFREKGFPTQKDEAWKFTSLKAIEQTDFSLNFVPATITEQQAKAFFIQEDSHKIVFVDGVLSQELSDFQSDDFSVLPLNEVLKSDDFVNEYFNKQTHKHDVFTALNTAFVKEGVSVHIPKNKAIEKPIELLFFTTNSAENRCEQPRTIIRLDENSQAKFIEIHKSFSENQVLTNSVTEVFVAQNAVLDYYKVQNDSLQSSLIDNTYISQKEGSNASVHTFSLGGVLTRNNLNFYHQGEHLESTLKGATIASGNQHIDHYTLVNHAEPNCESHQDYKTILSGESSAVFNGKIMVEKIAQKTNAYQQNDAILLSDKASMNTKPQLEIFADDVKCSHGCTIGELNEQAMFYLRARGIPKKQAEVLLTHAFVYSVVQSIKIPQLKEYVENIISQKLK